MFNVENVWGDKAHLDTKNFKAIYCCETSLFGNPILCLMEIMFGGGK